MHDNETLRKMLTPGTLIRLELNGYLYRVLSHEGEETVVGQRGWEANSLRLPTTDLNDAYVPSIMWGTKVRDLLGSV